MSHNSNQYLKLCQELKHKGIEFEIEPGVRLGRGFADLGFEEFYLLPNNKLVSIYLGTQSEFRTEQQSFFFVVPEERELISKAAEYDFNPANLKFSDNLEWLYESLCFSNLNELLINYLLMQK